LAKNLIAKEDCSKEYHKNDNISLFTVGDKVLLHDGKVRRGRSLKLSPLQTGPYLVTDIDDINITLKLLKNRTLKVHAIRQEQMVLEIRGAGKLILNNMRKAYRAMVLIQAQMAVETNNRKRYNPSLSPYTDCCQSEGKNVNLNDNYLDLPLKKIINHFNNLCVAGHKVDEVENLISEKEWRMKLSNIEYHLSFPSYVGTIITGLIMFIFCYCCCWKCCCKNCPNL
jgi:hypothetical protein